MSTVSQPDAALEIPYSAAGHAYVNQIKIIPPLLIVIVAVGFFLVWLQHLQLKMALTRELTDAQASSRATSLTVMLGLAFAMVFVSAAYLTRVLALGKRSVPVALRLDRRGVTVWPLVGGDHFLPWAAVTGLTASADRLRIHCVDKPTLVPGVVGLHSIDGRMQLRQSHQSLQWRFLEAPPAQVLADAVADLSGGRVQLSRG